MNDPLDRLKTSGREDPFYARLPAHQKRMLEEAAVIQGRNLADFIVTSALEAAHRTLQAQGKDTLSSADTDAFVASIVDPTPVNDRLGETIRIYRDKTGA